MLNIQVHRYEGECGYLGWIEPDDKSWIIFISKNGKPTFYATREESGAVV